MKRGPLLWWLCLAAVILPGSARGAVEQEFVRRFPVPATGALQLTLQGKRGRVEIQTADTSEVMTRVLASARTEDVAEGNRLLAQVGVAWTQDGNVIAGIIDDGGPILSLTNKPWPLVDLDVQITVPRTCNVELRLGEGSISVGELSGSAAAELETGTIYFKRLQGPLTARCGRGEIIVSRVLGDIRAEIREGSLQLGTLNGRAELENRSGDIEVVLARGPIQVKAVAGDVSIGVARSAATGSRIETSGGDIFLGLDPESNVEVKASSVWGKVRSRLPLTRIAGEIGSRRFEGRLNQGGSSIEVRADGGHVFIESRREAFDELSAKEGF